MVSDADQQSGKHTWELPPLILHPFADRGPDKADRGVDRIVRAAAPHGGAGSTHARELPGDEVTRHRLDTRYAEFRMLCFIGKDAGRWMEQCMDFVERNPELANAGIRQQSFAQLLIHEPPSAVNTKLRAWGVSDYRSIFTRALGLHAIFPHVPEPEVISEGLLRNFSVYAESLFGCWQQFEPYTVLDSREFHFELYGSGEYSNLLERQWKIE